MNTLLAFSGSSRNHSLNTLLLGKAEENEPPLSAFSGKFAGLMAASPGALGGLRSLWALRTFLQNVGVVVAPTLAAVGSASAELFAAEDFSESANGKRLRTCVEETLKLIG